MNVALVGCGRWGVHVLRDLRALGCAVTVVARSEASAARARDGGADRVVASVSDVAGVRGVVVATSTSTHVDVLREALGLGVPVFVEKPLCADPDAARSLAEDAGGRLFVMDKWRYHPGVHALRDLAASGDLGPVRGLRTTRVGWGTLHDDVDGAWVLAPHDLSIALEILGEVPEPVAARGCGARGDVVLHGLLDASGRWHVLEVAERSPERVRRVELQCDGGVAVLGGGWDDHVTAYRVGGSDAGERIEAPGELPLLAELRAFLGHLDGGPPPRSSAREGARVVEAIAGLRRLAGLA